MNTGKHGEDAMRAAHRRTRKGASNELSGSATNERGEKHTEHGLEMLFLRPILKTAVATVIADEAMLIDISIY
jgi:hypothetical protein